jgi:catechol 2,3-dioxygenase-like lactoylglutathione lyase family enzyme
LALVDAAPEWRLKRAIPLVQGVRFMVDRATPNLPSRDFTATARFYAALGFAESWRDAGWMILHRGGLIVEFFRFPDLDPATSAFGSCFRMDDVDGFFAVVLAAGIPETTTGWPRAHRPRREDWGGRVGALIDPDGTLIRLVQEPD